MMLLGDGGERSRRVTVWASERAASHEHLPERATGYVAAAVEAVLDDVTVTYGGSVAVSTERAYELLARGEWPRALAEKVAGGDDDVGGLNLLVTDGRMTVAPTGMGVPTLAAVGGARHIARMPPASETPPICPFSYPAFVTQVLVHECGHALGLNHDHGVVEEAGDAVRISPMVSGYAWASAEVRDRHFEADGCVCGGTYPDVGDRERLLMLRFSACARRQLR